MKKDLHYQDSTSNKFWNIEVSGKSFTVTYGKSGTAGTSNTKTFDSQEACLKEATKVLNEKLKKGYVEIGSSTNADVSTKKSATKKVDSKTQEKPQSTTLRRLPPVSKFATSKRHPSFKTFDESDLELFDQGYPELVLLDDAHKDNKKWEEKAIAAQSSIDPVYDIIWPTKVAIAYVHTYPTDPGYDKILKPKFEEKWKKFLKLEDKTPTLETARIMLDEFMPGDDVYSGWQAPPAFYILEHFIGAEALAGAIVERLATYTEKQWNGKQDKDGHTRIALKVLGYLMLRMSDDARKQIEKSISQLIATRPKNTRLSNHLAYLPDKSIDMPIEEYSSAEGPWFMSGLTVTAAVRWKNFEKYGAAYIDQRAMYLEGMDKLIDADMSWLLDGISKASMLGYIETLGKIKHPYTVRLIISFGKSRAVLNEVLAWKEQHADYVESVLPMFANDEFVQKGLQGLDPSVKPMKRVKDPMAATEKIMEKLEKALPKAFPDQEKVTALVKKALVEAREIARMDGQDYLECYFGALWAEFPFSLELTEEQSELLYEAYEEVIYSE
jgi:predicted DNA-binding WGR domain protein